ncbi:MAG: ATPase, T2SS/T4P/T4SS family, partial [Patescibacteria group bacterium]
MHLPIPAQQIKKRLVDEGLLAPEKFDALLNEAERKNQNLIDLLISEKIANTSYLYGILAEMLGVEMANLGARTIDESVLRLLSEEASRQRRVILFGRNYDGSINAAMMDPSDLETIEFLSQRLQTRVLPFLAMDDDLNRGFSLYGLRSAADFKKIIEDNVQESLRAQSKSAEEAAADLPIVAIVDNIIAYAASLRSSDVHIEILEDVTMVRYRIDGILYEIVRIPSSVHSAIVARIKILSGLKIDEHYKPQDGRF